MISPAPSRQRSINETAGNQKPKRFLLILLSLVGVTALGTFLWKLRPRAITCLTSEHTVCPSQLEKNIQERLAQRSFAQLSFLDTKKLTQELQVNEPTLLSLKLHTALDLTVEARVTLAESLMVVRWKGEQLDYRANGLFTPRTTEYAGPTIELNANIDWTARQSELKNLGIIVSKLRTFSPKIQKVVVQDPTIVEVYPDGFSRVLMRINDETIVSRQLEALQAFFHSTTMNADYHELDLRYADVVVRE